ncbi:hypothetical protein T484DRAFT_1939608 [Baffinella frigidus]|nr:hypothetical protein T484DRAFT_1939608 [Cryptophyta sp. CCMP2293]
MKEWSKRETMAEKLGGAEDKGFASRGLIGDMRVVFELPTVKPLPKKSLWRKLLRRGPSKKAIAAAEAEGLDLPEVIVSKTMALLGQPLGDVAAQAGQPIKYLCKKGECGTCEVRIDGKWVRTCVSKVPSVPAGEALNVFVRAAKITKKATAFFSFTSFLAGFRNNLLGMFGFVTEGFKGKKNFDDRIGAEAELAAKVAARKAAKAKAAGGSN